MIARFLLRFALLLAALAAPVQTFAGSVDEAAAGLRQLQAEDLRVARVTYRLAVAGADLCLDTGPLSGILVHGASQYSPDYRPAARQVFGLGDLPGVEGVVPGSAADRAGLVAGDTLLAVNGEAFERYEAADKAADYAPVAAAKARLQAALAKGPVTLHIKRGGEARTIRITPDTGCASTVQLLPSDTSDAGADGRMISITTEMVAQTHDDDELAVVIGHEMAHNALRHRQRLDAAGVSRGLLRIFGKNASRIKETEIEADHLGLYLMARAGFDIQAAPRFWERYGKAHDMSFLSEPTHPRWKTRVRQLTDTIVEIRKKEQTGQPLVPPSSLLAQGDIQDSRASGK